jgi:hypothetical protein
VIAGMPRDVMQLASMISDPGWQVYKAKCESAIKVWETLLKNPDEDRARKLPDNYLRGRIDALELAINWPKVQVDQHVERDDDDQEDARREAVLDARTRLGASFPG